MTTYIKVGDIMEQYVIALILGVKLLVWLISYEEKMKF